MQPNTQGQDKVKGTLSRVIFSNDSGFMIGSFDGSGTEDSNGSRSVKITSVFVGLGNILEPKVGMTYILRGRWIDHDTYGRQYQFNGYEIEKPRDRQGIFRYLVRVAKWVGTATGNALVNEYGANTLEVLRTRPDEVADRIKGLTIDRAKEIQQALIDVEDTEAAMVELEEILAVPGMRRNLATQLIKKYGSNAPTAVRENPYIITEFHGIGFRTADTVALLRIGTDKDSLFRKMAAAGYVIKTIMQAEGSVWVHRQTVEAAMRELLQVQEVAEGIDKMIDEDLVVDEDGYVSLARKARKEALIAHKIGMMV